MEQGVIPQVAVIMGSKSDLGTLDGAFRVLDDFGVPWVRRVMSAHRTPADAAEFAASAAALGLKVIICAAGMAAHLPGMCAAIFPLPVIGIPMHTTSLGGKDSLYSIVQMPPGIPVATVAINGGVNAALLAVRMLAVSDDALLSKLEDYSKEMEEGVAAKDRKLAEKGYRDYSR